MPGFNGLRVLSFESRRAQEIAHLIANHGGVPTVAPSTREIPDIPKDDELELIRGILAHQYDVVIFMTGVGARAFIDAASAVVPRQDFLAALSKTRIVVRGAKPAGVMRELAIPVWLNAPEPNTWREIVQVLDQNSKTVPLPGLRIGVQEHGAPSSEMYAALRERGASVFAAHVYRWELPEDTGPLTQAVQAVCSGNVDVVMFTSSVQLNHVLKVAAGMKREKEFIAALNRVVVASIGPVASAALCQQGISVDLEPSHPKMGFLVKEAGEKSADLLRSKAAASRAKE
ncbi:MAG TPA: uroporphyrinogen-III synthase [Terriglobales bacterium]|nr:uroporphyrinogen-III synthase [Terriglobales bacterium]